MSPYSILAILLSFFATLRILPSWIFRAKKADLIGSDVHKADKRNIAELGGLPVICGFLSGVLVYIAFRVFVYQETSTVFALFAIITSILIAAIIGLVDDILGWKIGLRQIHKFLFTIAISLPIIVINAGNSIMNIPFLGPVEFGRLYPFLIIPVAMIGASNAFNMIAGFNGLEAGMGIIILTTLSFIAYKTGTYWLAVMGLCMVSALAAFMIYNFYPSKIFPGDILTYSVGAMIGIMAIMGNMEKFALIMFIPYFIEFFLKARGKMKKESFGKRLSDGSITNRYKEWYGIEHIAISFLIKIKKKAYEWEVVLLILGIQSLLALATIGYYFI